MRTETTHARLGSGQTELIHTLFENQVRSTPNTIALVFEDQELSCHELNLRANRLAYYLQQLGVGPEMLIGVCLERSTEMIVALLAILKAGGAYVPLDPTYPRERIAFILADTAASLVLSQHSLRTRIPETSAKILCLDTDWELSVREITDNPSSPVTPDNLAYIIYTSGSTGRPKGVAIAHHSAAAMLNWAAQIFPQEDLRGVLAATSICFDLSVFELFLPLSQGGTIILAQNALQLPALPARQSVTLVNTVPSVMTELIQANGLPDSLRTVNLAGEPLRHSLVQKVHSHPQVEQVYNLYGPSEDTTYSTFARIDATDPDEPSIGQPIDHTQAYVLDQQMQPAPSGTVGELYLAGKGLARGYLNRPDLTAECFVPDPFSGQSGARLYRTGDLARWLPDGDLEFLGRIDNQVKIRGFRIELGEVEAALSRHPKIQQVVVVAHEDSPGDKYLVAYLVAHPGVDRVAYRGKCQIYTEDATRLDLNAEALSEQGLTIEGRLPSWQYGHALQLDLQLPGISQEMTVNGAITWLQGTRAGVQLDTSPTQQTLLRQSMQHILRVQEYPISDHQSSLTRVQLHRECLIEYGDGHKLEAMTTNYSSQGVGLSGVQLPLEPGQRLRINLDLPGVNDSSWLSGQIAWQQGERLGINLDGRLPGQLDLQQSLAHNLETGSLSVGRLRSFLQEKLPDYMIPSVFVQLETLPLTPNGKIDRQALPLMRGVHITPDQAYHAPQTPTEEVLAGIWSEVLSHTPIGIHDDFFELGGHSLSATQVLTRVRTKLQVELDLHDFYEAANIAELAEHIEKTKVFSSQQPFLAIEHASRDRYLPLSFDQQRVRFMSQLAPDSAIYNIPAVFLFHGALNPDLVERCLNEIVRRHEILRTVYVELDGQITQKTQPHHPIQFQLADLRDLPKDVRGLQAQNLLLEQAQIPFDLEHGPLLRALLIRLDETHAKLLLNIHHIASDGWSSSVILDELGALYDAFSRGLPPPLPELTIQYVDFANWQRQYLQGAMLDEQRDYWHSCYDGKIPVLALPTDRPRPPLRTFRGNRLSHPLPLTLIESLEDLSRRENSSLFMTMLAAFNILLHRYTGQTDLVVGTVTANRVRPELENLVGFFVNTLPLRNNLAGNPTFKALLQKVRKTTLAALSNADIPLEKIVEALIVERDPSQNPLFQVIFVVQNTPKQVIVLPDLRIQFAEELDTGTAKLDLSIFVEFIRGKPLVIAEYNTDLFDASTVERMLRHFEILLEGVVAQPDRRINDLPILTAKEWQQLLVDWNQTTTEYPREVSIQDLFEVQVERTPDAIALVCEDQSWSYHELNCQANRLAHHLRDLGVGPDQLVGICVERCWEVPALLGILKAGGAYLPLEPTYPDERLAFLIQEGLQAQTRGDFILLIEAQHRERFSSLLTNERLQLLCLDEMQTVLATEPQHNPSHQTDPDNLAYVMYTSGSTGQPKGVSVAHHSILRLVQNTNYLNFSPEQVFLRLAPLPFDASTLEIWGPLLNGGRLVVFPDRIPTLEKLGQSLREKRITTLWLTAGLFHQMVDHHLDDLKGLHHLLAGGDVLSVPHVGRVLTELPNTQLINGYGPTENTTFSCCYPVSDLDQIGTSVPIGRPINNTRAYILDAHLLPVPVGVTGELYLAGDGLARGYLNRPDLTAQAFVPDPFGTQPGSRLYRTGDRVRWLPSGEIEFLGRVDHQIKLRGFRIELGEIESTLIQHPKVHETLVIVREDRPGDKRLVAYLLSEDDDLDIQELRIFLKHKLPKHMIPTAFVTLTAFPLNPNGKIDRKALPEPEWLRPDEESYVAPRNPTEEVLAGIWSSILGVDPIGIHDNFFDLGGHSLLATQIMSKVRSAFQVEVSIHQFFNIPTVAGLATMLDDLLQVNNDYTPIETISFQEGRL